MALSTALAEAEEDWWIIGSAAVALHGAETPAADVDLLTTPGAARRLARLWGVTPPPPSGHQLFRSQVHFEHALDGVIVDVMAELEVRAGDGWIPVRPSTRLPIAVQGATLYAPAREELIDILELFGRPKDLQRAGLLA